MKGLVVFGALLLAAGAAVWFTRSRPCEECDGKAYVEVRTYNKAIKDYWTERFPCRSCLAVGNPKAIEYKLAQDREKTKELQRKVDDLDRATTK